MKVVNLKVVENIHYKLVNELHKNNVDREFLHDSGYSTISHRLLLIRVSLINDASLIYLY